MPVRTLRIEVLGSSFTIQTDETPDYLREVVARFTRKADEVRAASRVSDPLKVAILAGLYLVDELERAKTGMRADPGSGSARETAAAIEAEADRLAVRMLERLDEGLARAEGKGQRP
ncbi:MAG: cell division protein ZapA [Spirochaetales bacterium]|nr:cell division protein ZapA [Spirochaetales bacterium]